MLLYSICFQKIRFVLHVWDSVKVWHSMEQIALLFLFQRFGGFVDFVLQVVFVGQNVTLPFGHLFVFTNPNFFGNLKRKLQRTG